MQKLCVLLVLVWGVALGATDAFGMPGAAVLGMSSQKQGSMGRISFLFDDIPEFEIQESGQRVRLRFFQTRIGQSFQKASPDEILVQIKMLQEAGDSIVELYLHNVPIHVDVTTQTQHSRLNVNIFWDERKLGARPAILEKRMGRVQPIKGGISAQKVIRSDYKGRWIDFFQEFEWPVRESVSPPLHFSFPPFPSPLFQEHEERVPQGVLLAGRRQLWETAVKTLADASQKTDGLSRSMFSTLLMAECRLRTQEPGKALELLRQIETPSPLPGGNAWKAYFRAYAQALSGKLFLAAHIAEVGHKHLRAGQALAPWYSLLRAELALATSHFDHALQVLQAAQGIQGRLTRIYTLRKADALYALNRKQRAFQAYREVASNLALLREYPSSLANWSELLYAREDFSEAYRYFLLLSEILKKDFSGIGALADYWSAMARWRDGYQEQAWQMFADNQEHSGASEAGFRSWLKLLDLEMLDADPPDLQVFLTDYQEIAASGPTRKVREEAYFKQILACHVQGRNLQAVKLLGRFFQDYWAGELQAEAQALFVEIFPDVVEALVEQGLSFQALALVTKHRDLLAQARITYDFLQGLAESYFQAGFLKQAAETYLYILDFEKNPTRKRKSFPPLLRVYDQLKAYEKVQAYAETYLDTYSYGPEKEDVLFVYIKALLHRQEDRKALRRLLDKNRPRTSRLDHLAGTMFFDLQRYDLTEYFLSRAAQTAQGPQKQAIDMKRAEAFYAAEKWGQAEPLYASLLNADGFSGQAAYRLIDIYFTLGQAQQALKLYTELTEKKEESQWLKLAAETISIRNSILKEN